MIITTTPPLALIGNLGPLELALVAFFVVGLAVVIALVVVLCHVHRAGPGEALIRTGPGPVPRVAIEGGLLALPILHRVARVRIGPTSLRVECAGPRALRSRDGLYVHVAAELVARIAPTPEGVLDAARVLGKAGAFTDALLRAHLEAPLVDAAGRAIADHAAADAIRARDKIARDVGRAIEPDLRRVGLVLDSVHLIHLDVDAPRPDAAAPARATTSAGAAS